MRNMDMVERAGSKGSIKLEESLAVCGFVGAQASSVASLSTQGWTGLRQRMKIKRRFSGQQQTNKYLAGSTCNLQSVGEDDEEGSSAVEIGDGNGDALQVEQGAKMQGV